MFLIGIKVRIHAALQNRKRHFGTESCSVFYAAIVALQIAE
jgi:hypothetical protein